MNRYQIIRRPGARALTLAATIALLSVACDSTAPTARPATAAPTTLALATAAPTIPSSTPSASSAPALIPQPQDPAGLNVAPSSARVDLAMPVFSNPTRITNPLFPVSAQASVLMHGHVGGKPFRTEVTLLPFTHLIDWQGQRIETVVSQYNAFLDGRIEEVAYDLYAQADDGSVWYLGEDVFDFADGKLISTEGTWQAGRDGPGAMIMPGAPKVGDVYRPENMPAFVFEEVTIQEVGLTVAGPLGPIQGAIKVLELHADGSTEVKVFAPGYGEFETGGDGDLEALALGVPTDALSQATPAELLAVSGGALRAFEAAGSGRWTDAADEVAAIKAALAGVADGIVPGPLQPLIAAATTQLSDAIQGHKAGAARNAAIELARLAFDVQLRYRPVTEIDLARADLWAAQLLVDAAAGNDGGVAADVFALDYVRDRFDPEGAAILNVDLGALQHAILDGDRDAAVAAATHLRGVLAGLS